MRLTLSMEEYDNLVEKLVLHDEQELVKLIRDRFKKSLPSKEGMSNKQEAGKNARKKVENINNKKIYSLLEVDRFMHISENLVT